MCVCVGGGGSRERDRGAQEEENEFDVAESKVKLDEVGRRQTRQGKGQHAGVQDEFTVAGVEGTLEDEVDADRKHDPYRAGYAPSSNGLTDEHGCTFLSFKSAV